MLEVIWLSALLLSLLLSGLGGQGSGVELVNVYYKGIKALRQAHFPILNVDYKDVNEKYCNTDRYCGPSYRDWQNTECGFTYDGNSEPVAPYFRTCKSRPTTIID
jgi:hypothetical protein